MGNDQELERLRRLRERQLTDRDPLVKQRQFQRATTAREKKLGKQTYSLGKMWKDIPHVWRGFFYGLVLGTLVLIVLPLLWSSPWAIPSAIIALVVITIFGVVVGRAIGMRENIKNLIR